MMTCLQLRKSRWVCASGNAGCVRLVVQVAMRRVRLLEQLFETAHPSVPAESRDKKRAEVRAAREF